ncbi:catalase 1 [Rhizina undulata]
MSTVFQRLQESLAEAKDVATSKVNDITSTNEKTIDLWNNQVNAEKKGAQMTTDQGLRIYDTDHWLKAAGEYGTGPSLIEDEIAREKINRFDHERIPERVVHARGVGAHGYFTLNKPIPHLTTAKILTDTTATTPLFTRFSTVAGSRGSSDTMRDVRGFAIKFYTSEGNWDIVGNNIPVFFIQDAVKFPDVIHAAKPEPNTEIPQAQTAHNNFWDFVNLHTEATHMYMWTMSDRAIPRSLRMIQGFGVNTFTMVNSHGERTFVKFHWTPELGVHSLVWDEALKLAGQDPDFHRRDLYEAIASGNFPTWKFGIQAIAEAGEHNFNFDILDATKVWPEDLVPIEYIGTITLNRNVSEFFTETEQVAFCTSHVVPGIGFSDDPLLQGRNFSYLDTQISRLGVNHAQLPINRPVCPVMNFNRDGAMNHRIIKGKVNYWPNRFEAVPPAIEKVETEGVYLEYAQKINGMKARMLGRKFKDHFSHAQLFWNSLSPIEKMHVRKAFSFELDHCDDPIVYKRLSQRLADVDITLARSVAQMVGGDIPKATSHINHGKKAPGLSIMDYPGKCTIATRRVAILIADGFDLGTFMAVRQALKTLGAMTFAIAPRRHMITPSNGDTTKAVMPEHHLEAQRGTMFDAVFICPGTQSTQILRENGRAIHWIREAFGHLKPIAALDDGVTLLQEAVLPSIALALDQDSSAVSTSYGVVTAWKLVKSLLELPKIEKSNKNIVNAFAYEISKHRCWDRELDGLVDKVAF